jgi:hypothetical protein
MDYIKWFVMSTLNLIPPQQVAETMPSFNERVHQSYVQAKKQFQESVTVIRDEFSLIYDKAGSYFTRMALPVNNFLKDLSQIEKELQLELSKERLQTGHSVVPVYLEENY